MAACVKWLIGTVGKAHTSKIVTSHVETASAMRRSLSHIENNSTLQERLTNLVSTANLKRGHSLTTRAFSVYATQLALQVYLPNGDVFGHLIAVQRQAFGNGH